uniref:Uncharacterized protein n=1 Tax=Utricularia reniformis TaxID=192314 RepID=A0A1Y0B1Q6_9LAMI|nr:hypothetical protein AEK19_MT1101 [Utricularia reniformis]ART31321.1 hypothetical protein AEK19_MT1101 [Utricularia reniformis]
MYNGAQLIIELNRESRLQALDFFFTKNDSLNLSVWMRVFMLYYIVFYEMTPITYFYWTFRSLFFLSFSHSSIYTHLFLSTSHESGFEVAPKI